MDITIGDSGHKEKMLNQYPKYGESQKNKTRKMSEKKEKFLCL